MSLHSGRLRVLVVDCDLDYAHSLAELLENPACETCLAFSCEEAVERANVFSPDVLICEVVMPGMSGIELAYHFAEDHPGCRLLLVSDVEPVVEVLECASPRDGFLFLRKPLNPAEVLEFLAQKKPHSQHVA